MEQPFKWNLFGSSFAHYLFLYFTQQNLVCFSRLAKGRNARVIHNYCENNKFKENFHFVKTQNSKQSTSIAAVLSRFPCLIFVYRFTTVSRCGAAVRILIPLVKGQGYFAERRMQNGIVLRRLENNAKLLSRTICILRTMPFYVLRSAKYPCRLVKVTIRTVLSPFKVVVTTQKCFQLVIYWVPADVWSKRATWFWHKTSTVRIRGPQHTVYIFIINNSTTHVQTIFPGCYRHDR